MSQPDPFAYHPELAGQIAPAETSFFREITVDRIIEMFPEVEVLRDWFHTDAQREESRRALLAEHGGGDLWIFGYGSLMWDPAMVFAEVRRVHVPGYQRRFILYDEKGARGSKEKPGLMAALDHGGACDGLAFRIEADRVDTETEVLWRREMIGPGYRPILVEGVIDGAPQRMATFLADPASDNMRRDLSEDETVHLVATGEGRMGTSRDYLANIVEHFRTMGIDDPDCGALFQKVEAYRAKRGVEA